MASHSIQQIKGYTVLPLALENTKFTPKSYHYLYLKKHTTKTHSESQTRALFVVNVPINSSHASIKKLFGDVAIGAIIESFEAREYYDPNNVINYDVDIDLRRLTNEELSTADEQKAKVPVGCGIVTFVDKNALNLALSSIKKLVSASNHKLPVWKVDPKDCGFERYTRSEALDSAQLKQEVSQAMADFQRREQEIKEELNEMKSLVDEDGFTLVVGSHRKTKNGVLGSIKKASELEKDAATVKKMKRKEKQDFYRFQIRERKKQEMNELLSKFKEDQERVKLMKEKRKFKPY